MILSPELSAEMTARLQRLVESALSARNLSARRASIDVVGHDGLIRDIRAGRMPSADRVAALLDYLGVSQGGDMSILSRGFSEPEAPAPHPSAASGDFVAIPYHPEAGGAGMAQLALGRGWLDERGLDPQFLTFATAPDDNMTPTISAFSQLLIDSRSRINDRPALFAVVDEGQFRVARVSRPSNGLVVMDFDKVGVAPVVLQGRRAAMLRALGRIVWVMRSL